MTWQLDVTPVGPLQMNAVLLTGEGPAGPEAILIDPGDEAPRLLQKIEQAGCRLTALLCTHGHFDHVGDAARIQAVHDLPLRCHPADLPLIEHMQEAQVGYGFPATEIPLITADLLQDVTIPFAGLEIKVTHVPGHSPGQLMFTLPGYAIVGDCLFAGSIGRTDLPGGDFNTLEKSIRECIYTLADETIVVCGHGPDTLVGREKATNPFVRG